MCVNTVMVGQTTHDALGNVEAEFDDANDGNDNIGPDDNDEMYMFDKIATNIESNTANA